MTPNDQLLDRSIRHDHAIARYRRARERDVGSFFDAEVVEPVLGIAAAPRRDPTRIVQDVREVVRDGLSDMRSGLNNELRALAREEAQWAARSIRECSGTEALPGESFGVRDVLVMGAPLDQWWRGLARDTVAKVSDLVRAARASGQEPDALLAAVRAVLEQAGRHAGNIVRTAVQAVAQKARTATFDANPECVNGILWNAILDARTTAICRERHGRVYRADRVPTFPAHWGERSSLVPVLKGEKRPEVPSYGDWLEEQPADVQDEAIGVKRAELFRAGRLSADEVLRSA